MKIGILGGSFNPIHHGHLIIAQRILDDFHLDSILFVPNYINPLKKNKSRVSVDDRVNMIQLAIENQSKFQLSFIEINKKNVSYTINTIQEIIKEYPQAELYLIVGDDIINEFDQWRKPEELLEKVHLIVFKRVGVKNNIKILNHANVNYVDEVYTNISSTLIRNLIQNGKSINFLVPNKVKEYIYKKKLYKY